MIRQRKGQRVDPSYSEPIVNDEAVNAQLPLKNFTLQQVSADEISNSDYLMSPIAPVSQPGCGHSDDSVIRRVSMAGLANLDVSASTRTTPRRPPTNVKYYLAPSSTYVASNGEVYHIEPFQLPPPSEIAGLFAEKSTHVSGEGKSLGGSPVRKYQSTTQTPSTRHPSLPSEWLKTPPARSVTLNVDTQSDEPSANDRGDLFVFSEFSWKKFILAEVFGVGNPGHLEPNAAEHVDNFLNVPIQLEKLIFFGFFVALDSFLYAVTYLPVRMVLALIVLLDECWGWVTHWRPLDLLGPPKKSTASPRSRFIFEFPTTRQYDLMRGLLLVIGCFVLSLVNMSRVYHYIRMQNTIKLYVLTAMMEVIDKLLCSFGIDTLDSLFWKTRARSSAFAVGFSFVVTAVYVVIHSGLYFIHLATLTVAINNVDQSLTTVLILNNFAEIKSFVLKKFDTDNLFQLACADITERFKMCLFYSLIILVGIIQSADPAESIPMFSRVLVAMLGCEMFVDWIKHAFIAKFNKINASCYQDFSRILRCDIFDGHKDKITLDHSYTITKRLGMSQIPLGCVFFRFMLIAYTSSSMPSKVALMSYSQLIVGGLTLWAVMIVLKILFGMCLIYYVGHKNNRERRKEVERKRKEARTQLTEKKMMMERNQSIEMLSNIEKYTVLQGVVEERSPAR